MNKLLLTSICAAAFTTSASAFTLDLTSLNGSILGSQTITNSFGSFTLVGNSNLPVVNNVIQLDNAQTLTVTYPSNIQYIGAFITGNAVVNDDPFTVTYAAVENGVGVEDIRFAELPATSVPEPSSAVLLGLGGLSLILRRRK